MLSADQAVAILEGLEPAFIAAAAHAYERQASAQSSMKSDSGSDVVDIVTEADLEVQELLLTALAATELRHCTVIAEEATRSTAAFANNGPFVITIDPIDGTKIFADGGKFFSTIISLHDRQTILYTFRVYPALKVILKIRGDTLTQEGTWPTLDRVDPSWKRRVIYISPATSDEMVQVHQELTARSLILTHIREIDGDVGVSSLFLMGHVGGYFCGHPNAYDGTFSLHYARAIGCEVIARGAHGQGDFTMSTTFVDPVMNMVRYPGYYYVLQKEH